MKLLILLIILCSCISPRSLQQGDKVNIGSVHGIVIKNDYGERRILILINSNRGVLFVAPENTYQIFDYKEIR
jgi:vacuolar-type H+-ATPase catalytic subunit A/Vma1